MGSLVVGWSTKAPYVALTLSGRLDTTAQIVQWHLLLLATKLKKQHATCIFEYLGGHDVSLQGSTAAYLMVRRCDLGTATKYC